MGNILLFISYGYHQKETRCPPEEGATCIVGPARGEPARDPHLPVLRAKIQINWLGQPHVSALFGGSMAGNLSEPENFPGKDRLPFWDAWAFVTVLSLAGWRGLLAVLL